MLSAFFIRGQKLNKVGQLSRRPFVRNVAAVATGTAASQAITVAFSPVIARLYGPDAFGLLGVFASVTGLLAVVADLGYPTAIVLPRDDTDATGLARLSIYIGIVTATLTTAVLYTFGTELLVLLNAEPIFAFMYLIPVAMLISVFGSILGQWLIRKRAYAIKAKYGALSTLLVNSSKSLLGLLHPTGLVLIATNTIGNLISTGLTYWAWHKSVQVQSTRQGSRQPRSSTWELARRHIDFPLLRTPQDLINTFSRSLPLLLLAGYFGSSAAGQYSIAMAVLGIPSRLIGTSVMAVFYPRINDAIQNGENTRSLIIKATTGMAIAGAVPFVIVMLFGPYLFELVFGKDWVAAGQYSQWLALWLFFAFINRPCVSAMPALRLQGTLLLNEIASVVVRAGALYVGFKLLHDSTAAIALFSIAGVVVNASLILVVIHASNGVQHRDE